MIEAASGSHPYSGSHAVVISEVDALAGAKGDPVIGGPMHDLRQAHWDTSSDNTLDGESFPLVGTFHSPAKRRRAA